MMPLCTTASPPEMCGWALRSQGYAVRRPARVRDAGVAGSLRFIDLRGQFGNPADRAQALQAAGVDQGQPGRVVAAVFELAQAFEEDGDDIAVSDRGNDATHGQLTS
jgi:hypothetical protein